MNYRSDLTENILPFWMKDALDSVNGGIYTSLDRNGKVYGTDKSVWFQGRALWSFSKAYNLIEKKKEYLEAAKLIYGFLPRCTDTDGRMFFTVTAEGKQLQKRRYYFSETFAAIGCAEYYKASGDPEAAALAKKYFLVAYECFTGVRKNPPKICPENCKTKALSPVMIMLSTAQTMRSLADEDQAFYNRVADECLSEILHGGYLTETALLESVTVDGRFLDTPTGRIVNPGHSLEVAWFLMAEGILTQKKEALEAAKKIIDITLPLGLDPKNGGIISFCDVKGMPPVQLEWDMKLWWPQCEAMIALRLAHLIFGEERYQKGYEDLKQYCEEHFVDKECGEWYGYLHYDNTPSTTLKGNIFKGPFHVPRFYMIMAALDRDQSLENYLK
ncbi:MAG: AGE family epimerase/isomerase [Clostridia bacterium]|nr:AGE family epimerase/isomerase [Clostridia bacterium]